MKKATRYILIKGAITTAKAVIVDELSEDIELAKKSEKILRELHEATGDILEAIEAE